MSTKQKILNDIKAMTIEEMYTLAYTDALTGVPNRRAFDIDVRECAAIVDVDSLKYINDNLGHRWGDYLLNNLACELVAVFGHDNVYRIGGDEFAVKFDEKPNRAAFAALLRRCPFFSHGAGATLARADNMLNLQKRVRERNGLRAARGDCPPWLSAIEDQMAAHNGH